MEISCTVEELTGSPDLIGLWDAQRLTQMRRHRHFEDICALIDEMGQLSKEAQGINAALTSVARLRDNPSHRLYLMFSRSGGLGPSGCRCLGIIKVGVKKLFIRNRAGGLTEIDPLCVLDFFVCTAEQRSGHGKVLYEHMLQREGVTPDRLGIDRPSDKFLGFMRKHYGLRDYVPQTNNFVVFSQYFEGGRGGGGGDASNPYARNYGGGHSRNLGGSTSAYGAASSVGRAPLTLDQARSAIAVGGGSGQQSLQNSQSQRGGWQQPQQQQGYTPNQSYGPSGGPTPHTSTTQLPPIRSGSIGTSQHNGSEGNSRGNSLPRQGSVEPAPNGHPPVPTSMHGHGHGPLAPVRTGFGDRGAAHGSFTGMGNRGRAPSPTIGSAVPYNILAPGGSLNNSRTAAVGGRRPW